MKGKRSKALSQLASGTLDLVVCSDALARGIDVLVDHVVSYDCPSFVKTYIHRVGRTARAGRSGEAVTLVEGKREEREFKAMLKKVKNAGAERVEVAEEELDEERFEEASGKAREVIKMEKEREKAKRGKKRKAPK